MMDELDAQLRDGDGDGDGFFTDVRWRAGPAARRRASRWDARFVQRSHPFASARTASATLQNTTASSCAAYCATWRARTRTRVDRAVGAVDFVQAKGLGYAMSTDEEMRVAAEVAATTGIVLDPTYGGKAVATMLREMKESPRDWTGRRVLVHTGATRAWHGMSPAIRGNFVHSCPPSGTVSRTRRRTRRSERFEGGGNVKRRHRGRSSTMFVPVPFGRNTVTSRRFASSSFASPLLASRDKKCNRDA